MSRKQGTMLNEARKFFPGCTEREAHDLFWNATAFPFCGINHIRKQLREAAHEGGGTPNGAMARAEEQMERAMKATAYHPELTGPRLRGSESSAQLDRLRVYAVHDGGECVWAITDDPEKARTISREYLRDSAHPEDYEGDDEEITEMNMDAKLSLWWEEDHISDGGSKLTRTCAEWIKDQGEGFLATTCI